MLRVFCLILVLLGVCACLPAQTKPFTGGPSKEFVSGGKAITVKLIPDVMVFEGQRSAPIRAGTNDFISGINSFADTEDPRFAYFSREGFHFAKTVEATPQKRQEIRSALRRTGKIQRVGIPVLVPRAGVPDEKAAIMVVTPDFVVRFKENVKEAEIKAINDKHKVEIVRAVPFVKNQFVLRSINLDPEQTLDLSVTYSKLPEVDRLSHPDFVVQHRSRAGGMPPNDPLFASQWHLHNTGQGMGKAGADVRALGAWKITSGSDKIVVAVIDPDGVQTNHEDLVANRYINAKEIPGNGIDDDNNGFIDDESGWNFLTDSNNPATERAHGTAAAGVAVASGDNQKGVTGIAPGCKLLAICQGRTVQDDADAFRYAAQQGARIISNSWGYSIGTPATQVVEEALEEVVQQKHCMVFFAMTNEKLDNFGGPGGIRDISSHPNVLAIGRSTNLDIWGHSGFGAGMALLAPTNAARGTPDAGCDPDDLAGTLDVVTTDLMGAKGYNGGVGVRKCSCNPNIVEPANANYTACFGGTSSATPLAAGVAALVLSVNPDLKPAEVRKILIETADKIDAGNANYMADAQGFTHSKTHGYGRVNAEEAVKKAKAMLGMGRHPTERGQVVLTGQVTETYKIEGEPADKVRFTTPKQGYEFFTPPALRALVLSPNANQEAVARSLGDRFKQPQSKWTALFREKNVLVLRSQSGWEQPQKELQDLFNTGQAESLSRIVAFKEDEPSTIAVLLPQVRVSYPENVSVAGFREALEKVGLEVVKMDKFDSTTVYVQPKVKGTDPFALETPLRLLATQKMIVPERTQLQFILPTSKRP